MNRLQQLLAKQAKNLARVKEIEAAAGDNLLTDEQRAELKTLRAEATRLGEDIADARNTLDQERQMATAAPTAADTTATVQATAAARVPVVDRAALDPKRGFKDHKDFLMSVMGHARGRSDDRLTPLREAAQGSDEQGAYSDPYGGFLVPVGVAPGILQIQPEDDPISALTTKPPMSAPTVKFNARVDKNHATSVSGGFVVSRRPETVDGQPTRQKYEQIALVANELFGGAFASETILTDSPESFVAIIGAGFRDEFAAKAIEERLTGTGVGEPMGVLNSPCLVSIAEDAAQAAASLTTSNIENMRARCWKYSRAIWMGNNDIIPQLMALAVAIGTAGQRIPYYTPATTQDGQDMLLGRPIYFSEHCSTLGTQGDLILGVWSEYLEGEYQPVQSAESIHVRFMAAERAFRFYKRNDGKPWWTAPLTPKKSAKTLSPFVVLDARA
jgi:HK97 family phage major capsid protein